MRNKNALKRINWDIATRLLETLYFYGNQKKTAIARLTNMSYDNCVLYLDWLDLLGFIKKETNDNRFEIIGLTEIGINFYKTKLVSKPSISYLEKISV